jgi:2-polyprenyl-3-methyl-5-hydroxy-6-metoxy-1,4-benzoquinol methylase
MAVLHRLANSKNFSGYYQNRRLEVVSLLPDKYTKVLEIGCGEGNFRTNLNNPHEYWGVDPAERATNIAKEKLDKVLLGFYNEIADQIPDNYFDLIICLDVIEHIENTNIFLSQIAQKMISGGCIVFSIPNVRYFDNILELLLLKD